MCSASVRRLVTKTTNHPAIAAEYGYRADGTMPEIPPSPHPVYEGKGGFKIPRLVRKDARKLGP
jgi:hypothetical protein